MTMDQFPQDSDDTEGAADEREAETIREGRARWMWERMAVTVGGEDEGEAEEEWLREAV